jgi:hypothetical protein
MPAQERYELQVASHRRFVGDDGRAAQGRCVFLPDGPEHRPEFSQVDLIGDDHEQVSIGIARLKVGLLPAAVQIDAYQVIAQLLLKGFNDRVNCPLHTVDIITQAVRAVERLAVTPAVQK